jgi:methylglutaconyl-CoA hydratase
MSYTNLRIEIDPRGVATILLTRPEKHNAINAEMIGELTAVMGELQKDDGVRVVVLTGEGKSFCAGGDLDWMRSQFTASREERLAQARKLALMLKSINELPKPVIARVQGQAFGGGVGIMSTCDAVIAAGHARFGLTETRLGLIPATISPYVVARMGEGNARRVMLPGRTFDCAEAHHLGLVSKIAEPAALDAAVEEEVKSYLDASPTAVAAAKALVLSLGRAIDDNVMDDTINRLAGIWETADALEGVSAFFEGRQPKFAKGRDE